MVSCYIWVFSCFLNVCSWQHFPLFSHANYCSVSSYWEYFCVGFFQKITLSNLFCVSKRSCVYRAGNAVFTPAFLMVTNTAKYLPSACWFSCNINSSHWKRKFFRRTFLHFADKINEKSPSTPYILQRWIFCGWSRGTVIHIYKANSETAALKTAIIQTWSTLFFRHFFFFYFLFLFEYKY